MTPCRIITIKHPSETLTVQKMEETDLFSKKNTFLEKPVLSFAQNELDSSVTRPI